MPASPPSSPAPGPTRLLYHGVLAPNAQWRPEVVAYGRQGKADPGLAPTVVPREVHDHLSDSPTLAPTRRRRQQWAELMTRSCPERRTAPATSQ